MRSVSVVVHCVLALLNMRTDVPPCSDEAGVRCISAVESVTSVCQSVTAVKLGLNGPNRNNPRV